MKRRKKKNRIKKEIKILKKLKVQWKPSKARKIWMSKMNKEWKTKRKIINLSTTILVL